MEKVVIFLFFLICFNMAEGQSDSGKLWFYTGTFTSEGSEGVYLCSFNPTDASVKLENTFKGFDDPSFLRISPDRKFLYVVNRAPSTVEPQGGYIAAFRINADKTLSFLNKQLTHGEGPCYVDVSADGRFVAVANYNSGTIALYQAGKEGSLSVALSIVKNEGSGPVKARQSGPHAHSVRFYNKTLELFSPDLGVDKVFRFELTESGNLNVKGQQSLQLSPGAGPRHMDFHPSKEVIYVINELNSTITCFRRTDQAWTGFQVISALPEGYSGPSFCADIHVSQDGRFLYGSNRGHNSIVVFRINGNTGALDLVGHVPTEGNWPRNFTLTPDGWFMLVGNQRSGNIAVFRINRETGMAESTGQGIKLPSPVCLEFL